MKINPKNIRIILVLSCIFVVLTLAGCLLKPAVTPALPDQPVFTHYRVTTQTFKDANPAHAIEIAWRASSIGYSFKLFKSENGAPFQERFDDGIEESASYLRKSCSCSFSDTEVTPGNTYSYYVLAYDDQGEVGKTETFTREIFLPPCTLKSPQDESEIDTPFPTFDWDSKALSKYLSRSKAVGYEKAHLKVKDETTQEDAWQKEFEEATISSVTYNEDGTGKDLVDDHYYDWCHWVDSYDAEGNLIASGYSNSWHFHYKGPIKAVLKGQIQIPETPTAKSRDVGGTIPLVDAQVTLTDSEGVTHTGTTEGQGQYIFPQVAPGTNYIITAVGEVDGNTIIYKDVVPTIALHEVFDAGIADAESTALALVMEAMLAADPNLNPEDIVLDDILNATNFQALVATVGDTLNAYGDVTTEPGVSAAVDAVEDEVSGDLFYFQAASHLHRNLNDEIMHYVYLTWNPIPDATEYQIFKKIGEGSFNLIELNYKYSEVTAHWFCWEVDVDPEVDYEYYIKAIIPSGNIDSNPEIVDTWLPATAPVAPEIDSIVTDSTPTFEWQSLAITLPYERVESGKWILEMTEDDSGEMVWDKEINDAYATSYTATSSEIPLVEGEAYRLYIGFVGNDGIDLSGKEIANSSCYTRFYYGDVVYGFEGMTFTEYEDEDGLIESVILSWNEYPGADDYIVWRKGTGETSFTKVDGEIEFEDNEYEFWDETVISGDTYEYYVEAVINEADNKQSKHIILDSWLDPVYITTPSPYQTLLVNPTFEWTFSGIDFTPNSSIETAELKVWVSHRTPSHGWEEIWFMDSDDLTTRSFPYGGDPLDSQEYHLEIFYEGYDETGDCIATTTGYQGFYYGFFLSGVSWIETIHDNPPLDRTRGIWDEFPGATSYQLYRKEGISGGFTPINDVEIHIHEDDNEYVFFDDNVSAGNTYQYYVEAKDASEVVLGQSNILTIDTWLSPISITAPENDSVINDITSGLHLEWTPPDSTNNISYIEIEIYDITDDEGLMHENIDDINQTSYTLASEDIDLQTGDEYGFEVCYHYEDSGIESAITVSRSRFYYGYQPFETTYRIETFAPNENSVRILWKEYPAATDYQVYKSTNGTNFDPLSGIYELLGDWYGLWDHTVNDGGTYYYYVVALDGGMVIQTGDTMEVNIWLPGIITEYPIEDEVISEDYPTFTWSYEAGISFPEGPFDFFRAGMNLYDIDDEKTIWEIELNDLDVFSYVYDGPDLISGHKYIWCRYIEGMGDDGIMTATAGRGCFYYGNPPLNIEGQSWVEKHPDESIEYAVRLHAEYPNVVDVNVYRFSGPSDNKESFELISGIFEPEVEGFEFWDMGVISGNTYSYYIVAHLQEGSSIESEIILLDSWFSDFDLESPGNNAMLVSDDVPIAFNWYPPTDINPGSITQGDINIALEDSINDVRIWEYTVDDLAATSTIPELYGDDPDEDALIEGNNYYWIVTYDGENADGKEIANTTSAGSFWYGSSEKVIIKDVIAHSSGPIQVGWLPFNGAEYFKIYKSTDGGDNYEVIFDTQYDIPDIPDETLGWWIHQNIDCSYVFIHGYYSIMDFTTIASAENQYFYYVTAYGGSLVAETEPSTSVMINTWLPASSFDSPEDNTLISVPNPLLEWFPPDVSLPYGSLDYGYMHLLVADLTDNREVWNQIFNDFTTSSVNCNGEDLIDGHEYKWRVFAIGIDNDSIVSSESSAGDRTFTYQAPAD